MICTPFSLSHKRRFDFETRSLQGTRFNIFLPLLGGCST